MPAYFSVTTVPKHCLKLCMCELRVFNTVQ